jgi:1-phosphatidylinositol-4-phosphate 5-kinase
VIDIFTEFNARKRLENIYKSVAQDAYTISCVPPQRYADRFYEFVGNAFI